MSFEKPVRRITPKKIVMIVYDITSTIVAAYLAALIFFEGSLPTYTQTSFKSSWFFFPLVGAVVFYFTGFFDQIWAYASLPQYMILAAGTLLQTIVMVLLLQALSLRMEYAIYVIYWFLLLAAILSFRLAHRWYVQQLVKKSRTSQVADSKKIRVLVVGAGVAGSQILNELKTRQVIREPVAIVDDNPLTHTFKNLGVPVLGDRHDIPNIVRQLKIDEIIIAVPSANRNDLRDIIEICRKTKALVRTIPFFPEILEGSVQLSDIKDVDIEDLLGREPVNLELDKIASYIKGKSVLVTGGGGSIGSELARQIAAFNPAVLVIFDIYENNAYELQQELKAQYGPRLNLKVLIGSVRDEKRLRDIFSTWKPKVIFHAAAHKHVPLMEDSPEDAVKNNLFGTWNVARIAGECGCERMVLISTDKAVNPTNVMGSTKRLAEMAILAMTQKYPDTHYAAVRFGNVLGSSGSVIPLFRRQIKEEHRVTVTHPDIQRYFMTIPEAARLVLQAGSFARGGEIFVLDMGEPVKIVDLARELISLSGFEPDVDIPIEFVGLRPGEKMYEELYLDKEGLDKTAHDKIFTVHQITDHDTLQKEVNDLLGIINVSNQNLNELVDQIINSICTCCLTPTSELPAKKENNC